MALGAPSLLEEGLKKPCQYQATQEVAVCHSSHLLQAHAGCHLPLESLLIPSRERQLDLSATRGGSRAGSSLG